MPTDNKNLQHKIYQHYKNGKLYEILDIAIHSETLEEMVVYKALYNSEKYGNHQIWVRPKKMFFEQIRQGDNSTPRFKLLEENID